MGISVDEYYLMIAHAASLNSECNRAKVGAALVIEKEGVVLGLGYNGSLPGLEHCTNDSLCKHQGNCIRTTHAEINALNKAIKSGWYSKLPNATLFSTHSPCYACIKTLMAMGIRKVVYGKTYHDEKAKAYVDLVGLEIYQVKLTNNES